MQALNEIGLKKFWRYIFFSFYTMLIDIAFLPPLKTLLIRIAGAKIGKNSVILNPRFSNLYHKGFSNLKIGDNCFIGDETMFDLADQIIMDDHVTISNRVLILSHTNVGYRQHPLQKYFPRTFKQVYLKKGCFIGAGAIILPGTTIGKSAAVGAGSVVTKNVPDRTVAVGVPARFLRKINKKT